MSGLRTCLPLPNVLSDIVIQYAQPFIIAIVNSWNLNVSLIKDIMPLLCPVLIIGKIKYREKEVEQICSLWKVPCEYFFGDSTHERVEFIKSMWGNPDFIFHMGCDPPLYSLRFKTHFKEQLVSLNPNYWYTISDDYNAHLLPPVNYMYKDKIGNQVMPGSDQALPITCYGCYEKMHEIAEAFRILKQEILSINKDFSIGTSL